jgi:hypothetical protein
MTVKTRKKRERDQRDELLDKIDFKGLAQEEVPGRRYKRRWKRKRPGT